MVLRWLCRQHRPLVQCLQPSSRHIPHRSARHVATKGVDEATDALDRTRNIGIIAHIDAGKTTTTERMLYYSGFSRRLGDVDEGSTITDFLPAERARGITIQSAAITFSWPPKASSGPPLPRAAGAPLSSIPHSINLIDTPGHADFTFEVLRSLRVLDGAVCILDGVAGVEAQTEKVWTQAEAYTIPRIVFVNKLDREGAAFAMTVREVGSRLAVWPAVCGLPWWSAEGKLIGVGDAVGSRGLRYAEGGDGKDVRTFNLAELDEYDGKLSAELRKARIALVELLSEHDDQMVEKYLEADEDHLAISPEDITASLRRCTLQHPQPLVPIFAGASFRNIGVQPLLDAVVDLLPSPSERPDPNIGLGNSVSASTLSAFLTNVSSKAVTKVAKPSLALQHYPSAIALAFKVTTSPRYGTLVYVRVYSGTLTRNTQLWNTTLSIPERAQKLLHMYADEAIDIDTIPAGSIGVIPGLKATRTGDTLIAMPSSMNPKTGPPAPVRDLQLRPIDVPPAVFFVSVEPNSLAEERHVQTSLALLLREDPSLHVTLDEESGQTHLAGMGELHLEIAQDRLVQDFKAKARIGKIEIGFREAITTASGEVEHLYDRDVSGRSSAAGCIASVEPLVEDDHPPASSCSDDVEQHTLRLALNNIVYLSVPVTALLPPSIPIPSLIQSLQTGALAALARGPTHAYPMHSTCITLSINATAHIFPNTTLSALSSAARLAVAKALRQSAIARETVLMEPVMSVKIAVSEEHLGAVAHDLAAQRGGSVSSLDDSEPDTTQSDDTKRPIDIERIYTPPDPFSTSSSSALASGEGSDVSTPRTISATVPLREMVGYLKHLRGLTGGRGTFTMEVDRFERMSGVRMKSVLEEMGRGD